MPVLKESQKLKKELTLWDVYAIATGAMFSSGFFLLPGLAAAQTGPSVFLAYLLSGLIVLPTMFSMAELTTALPRAGGTYYIIDRSLGPLIGTVGGFGSWLALVLKSAFALIGMGAYLAIFYDLPITAVAVALTIIFGILNIIGAKETTLLQKILVAALVSIMLFYVVQGLAVIFSMDIIGLTSRQFTPFFINGAQGLFATVGMVFVSYAGLTKVASVAEEVKDPDKNIPLGMFLSIATAIFVYVAGVYIMVALLNPAEFHKDLTPVATAGQEFLNWLPEPLGLGLVVIAAIAAFASTGNAGILSASRYPFAMARDKLITDRLGQISKMGTPVPAIIGTVVLMILFLVAFNVAEVAKLASAFQLLLFTFLNLAVIVMRESKIEEYDPGFHSPFYPWIQIAGMILSIVLILEMGFLPILFTLVVSVFAVGWYYYYVHGRVERQGAIYHIHARLGRYKDYGLEQEMRGILREKGLREEDPYEAVASRAIVLDIEDPDHIYEDIVRKVCARLSVTVGIEEDKLYSAFTGKRGLGAIPIGRGAALNHMRVNADIHPEMALVRIGKGLAVEEEHFKSLGREEDQKKEKLHAIFFLVSPEKDASRHLRFLAHIADMVDQDDFLQHWLEAEDEAGLREILLRDERFISLKVQSGNRTGAMIGKKIREIDLPGESLIAVLKREGNIKIPHGNTIIQKEDELSIIGEKKDIDALKAMRDSGRYQ